MPVNQMVMATGDWSIRLRDDTPLSVRNQITIPFSHIVITPAPVDPARLSDAAILTASRYVGVCLRPGPSLELSGAGLAWWLGDDNGKGPLLETPVAFTAAGISTWVNGILSVAPISLALGSAGWSAGTLSTSYQWLTKRQALDHLVRYYFGLEWIVSNDFTVTVNTVNAIYGSTPTAIITPRASGVEGGRWGLSGRAELDIDWEEYTTRVVAVGSDVRGVASSTSPFYDGRGNVMVVSRLVDAPEAAVGSATTVATNTLAPIQIPRYETRLSASSYDVAGKVACGGRVFVYDVENGFYDTANQVQWQGQTIFPLSTRVFALRWPVQRGMGVLWRQRTASGVTYTDLTPFVDWEDGDTTLEVGGAVRPLTVPGANLAQSSAQMALNAWAAYHPTGSGFAIGNGTFEGRFRRDGTTLHLWVRLVFGTTTTTSGGFTFSLPSGVVSAASGTQLLTTLVGWAGSFYGGAATLPVSSSTITPWANITSHVMAQVSNTSPGSWTAGNSVTVQGTIEVAP